MNHVPVSDNLALYGCILLIVLILYLLCGDDVSSPGSGDIVATVAVVIAIVAVVLFFVL